MLLFNIVTIEIDVLVLSVHEHINTLLEENRVSSIILQSIALRPNEMTTRYPKQSMPLENLDNVYQNDN